LFLASNAISPLTQEATFRLSAPSLRNSAIWNSGELAHGLAHAIALQRSCLPMLAPIQI
jgi:hypothetical protein